MRKTPQGIYCLGWFHYCYIFLLVIPWAALVIPVFLNNYESVSKIVSLNSMMFVCVCVLSRGVNNGEIKSLQGPFTGKVNILLHRREIIFTAIHNVYFSRSIRRRRTKSRLSVSKAQSSARKKRLCPGIAENCHLKS